MVAIPMAFPPVLGAGIRSGRQLDAICRGLQELLFTRGLPVNDAVQKGGERSEEVRYRA
jgi:hypothetical protein